MVPTHFRPDQKVTPDMRCGRTGGKDQRVASDIAEMQGCVGILRLGRPRFNVMMSWHERRQNDPAHQWLRETIVASAVNM